MTREAQVFWKKYIRVEKTQRKHAEKQALTQRRIEDEMREVHNKKFIGLFHPRSTKSLENCTAIHECHDVRFQPWLESIALVLTEFNDFSSL